jgi:NitT/TauT family transport system ATP-binding protein
MMTETLLQMNGVTRAYGAVQAIGCLDIDIRRGEFVAVVGPSGCGKTTLLNLLSGYDTPTAGAVVRQGSLRMVYQQDGLFPWLTVAENIDLGLRQVAEGAERARLRQELLNFIGLEGFADHYPHQLSGGMRQRVELARALAGNSDVLLMDEPFSALDYLTRLRMRQELTRLLHERPRTVVFVTHDIEEAAQLADRIIVLTARPARVQCEINLADVPRPRSLTHPQVVAAVHTILTEMGLDTE